MRVKRICYPVNVLGPGKRVGIWLTGCSFYCPGCSSPELQDPNAGKDISVPEIINMIKKIDGSVDGFTISGGEPFEQAAELRALIDAIAEKYTDDIIIYTGYYLSELQARQSYIDEIIPKISVLVEGRYIDSENDGIGLRGSKNQNILIFKNTERYSYMNSCERELQVFNYQSDFSLVIGIL